MIFKVILLSITISCVVCNKELQKECVKKGLEVMYAEARGTTNVRDDRVLFDSSQRILKLGIDMVHKRMQTTRLDCYYDFIKKYRNALKKISEELNDRLEKSSSPKERTDAVTTIAAIAQVMRCDEESRAKNLSDSVQCSRKDEIGGAETKFNSLYNILRGMKFLGNLWETTKNKVIEGIINYDLQVYSKMYGEAKACVSRQRKVDKCPNLKALADELERFFSLFQLIDTSKSKG